MTSIPPPPADSEPQARRLYPNLPAGLTPDDVPILSRRAVDEIIGQVVQFALTDNCHHSISQADCFSCGMDHAFRGLVAAIARGTVA